MKNQVLSHLVRVVVTTGLMNTLFLTPPKPVYSQIVPQAWVSLGGKDGDFTYAGGVRFLNIGLEVGTGAEGATGGDILAFLNLPFVSPFVGVGIYSGDDTFAYSGGVQLKPPGNFFFGGGYHSLRGLNGQIGIKF